jgi:hypothetical protein
LVAQDRRRRFLSQLLLLKGITMNLQQVVALGQTIGQLFPVIDSTIKGIESALPAGTSGTTKLEVARTTIASIFSTIEGLAVTFEQAWPAISGVIGALVTAYNAVGLFKKGQTAA